MANKSQSKEELVIDMARLFRRTTTITELEMDVDSNFATEIARGLSIFIANVLTNIGMCIETQGVTIIENIKELPLNSNFKINKEGICTLANTHGNSTPTFSLSWRPPIELQLVFATVFSLPQQRREFLEEQRVCCVPEGQYLIAYNILNNKSYQLPIGNLYDDLKLCAGEQNYSSKTILDSHHEAKKLFILSKWNADLMSSDKETMQTQLFRFKIDKENKEPIQQGYPENWETLLTPASNSFIDKIVKTSKEIIQK